MIFEEGFEGGGTAQGEKSDQRGACGFEEGSQAQHVFRPPWAAKVRGESRWRHAR